MTKEETKKVINSIKESYGYINTGEINEVDCEELENQLHLLVKKSNWYCIIDTRWYYPSGIPQERCPEHDSISIVKSFSRTDVADEETTFIDVKGFHKQKAAMFSNIERDQCFTRWIISLTDDEKDDCDIIFNLRYNPADHLERYIADILCVDCL